MWDIYIKNFTVSLIKILRVFQQREVLQNKLRCPCDMNVDMSV